MRTTMQLQNTQQQNGFSGSGQAIVKASSGLWRVFWALLFFALASGVPATCFAQGPCGGNGQRACCNLAGEFSSSGGACNSGLSYSGGCTDPKGCACSTITYESSIGMCYQATACGGAGQRACCNGNGEFAGNGLACDDNLVQITGTCGSDNPAACVCGNPGNYYSAGLCVQPAPCGGKGQRACCTGFLEYSDNHGECNGALTKVPGCSGDCTCGGKTSIGEPDGNSCTAIEAIPEPPTNATPTTNETNAFGAWTLPPPSVPNFVSGSPECPERGLCGYADLHVHMFAELAHGGATLAGKAWDLNGVNTALGEDYGSSLNLVDKNGNAKPAVEAFCPDFLRNTSEGNLCNGQVLFHGDHTALDTVTGGGTNDGANSNLGVPLFNGWPLWSSTIHQQVYYTWLERAWLGGLRLMVMDAVTNETLCKSGTKVSGSDCSLSMTTIDDELQAARGFQNWLDGAYGGPGKGWFQIVTTPQQATTVIQQGKLAVVLGIEVDNLFNCHLQNSSGQPVSGEGPACDATYIHQQLQKYYGMGVRHIFPIHNFDNAYGTPAAWQDAINVGNKVAEGGWWDAVNCTDPGYGFYLDPFTDGALYLLGFGQNSQPNYSTFTSGSCHNTPGLTGLGVYLIQQAMNMGMIIDVDHMSINAFKDTIDLANRQTPVYPGIAATHVQFFDLYTQNFSGNFGRHERMRTYSQLQSIKNVGGMIAAMLKDDVQDTEKGWCLPQGNCAFGASNATGGRYFKNYDGPNAPGNFGNTLNNNCRYSTTEWAQAYLYGVTAMGDNHGGAVAMGSDFNGIAGHIGPRFGNGACGGSGTERAAQEFAKNRLIYPFTIPGFGTFDHQVSGQKVYDFNVDGLAHIGLLPDMVADLKQVGVQDVELQPLFGSAQAYITMWSNANQRPPAITSASLTTFTVGTAGSFNVTATGAPPPTFSETGVLPTGVKLDSTTGLLSGTPAAGTGHLYALTLTASNGVSPGATQLFLLRVTEAPTITSANTATFRVGTASSFAVTATGFEVPTFSETGTLPRGVSLDPTTGALSGIPAAGTGGVYQITITANNGIGTPATQSFTLILDQALLITSASATTFTVGTAGSFTITATGFPAPTFSEIGNLPSGVTLNSKTGVLSGTPAPGTGGVHGINILVTNGVTTPAHQRFSLTVDEAPAITSANAATFTVGANGSFIIAATGFPAPNFTETGALPSGVTLDATTGVLSGIPAPGTGGVYTFTICACNGVLPNATQSFTLNVQDFTISAFPTSKTISAGQNAIYLIRFTSLGGLSGNVSLSCSGGPPNSTCIAKSSSVPLNGVGEFTISLLPPKNEDLGTFDVVFTGQLASLTHTANVTLTVK